MPTSAVAAKSDYELLVQRNLELREKVGMLEQKYAELENERNVLIGHVRNLQQEKEGLLTAQKDVKADKRYRDLEAAFDEVSGKIEAATQERDRLARELDLARQLQQDSQTAAKKLEAENAGLLAKMAQTKGAPEQQRSRAAEQSRLTSEKQSLEKQLRSVQETLETKERALEAKEKEWAAARSSCEADKAALKRDIEKAGKEQEKGQAASKSSCEADKTALKKDFDKLRKENDAAQARIRSLEDASSAIGQRYDKLEEELKVARGDLRVKEEGWAQEKKNVESDKNVFAKQLTAMEERIAASEKAWGAERESFQAKEAEFQKAAKDKEAESQRSAEENMKAGKERAIDLAFYKARETDLAQKHKALLSEYDQLKADVQRLTKVNAALKDTEQKLQQAQKDLSAARADSRKLETGNKKLENKIAKLNIFKTRVKQTEEDLRALQMLKKEHEAMIRKLTMEKVALEARLTKFEAPAGVDDARDARRKGTISPANKQKLDMHFNLAVTYDKTKMYKAEEREYLECLRIDPDDANVHYNLGILYDDKLNDNAKAIKHYRRYLEVCTTCEDAEDIEEWIMHAEQQQRL